MARAGRTVLLLFGAGLGLAGVAAWIAWSRTPPDRRAGGAAANAPDEPDRPRAERPPQAVPGPDGTSSDDHAPPAAGPRTPDASAAVRAAVRTAVRTAGRRILFPADAEPIPGPLAEAARRLLDAHREELGLDAAEGEWTLLRETTTLSGRHLRLRQTFRGVPVEGGEAAAHVARDGRPLLLRADVFPVGDAATEPRIDAAAAVAVARDVLVGDDEAAQDDDEGEGAEAAAFEFKEPVLLLRPGAAPDGKGARLVWRVDARAGDEPARVTVDAIDGEPIDVESLRVGIGDEVTGVARVFRPNPAYTARNPDLRDRSDRNGAALEAEMVQVDLPRLDGTGLPRGRWCDATLGTVDLSEPTHDWRSLTRSDAAFEAVSAYHHVDRVQDHLQSLGISGANEEAQAVDARGLVGDRSFYDVFGDVIRFGIGGVDDAEDGDVVVHEYAHAIHFDQVPDFGLVGETGAMGEGFGDFLACAMHSLGHLPDTVWDPRVASWDATSYSRAQIPFLRRVDRNKRYPRDFVDEPHDDGEMWSRFLWDLYRLVGHDDALRVVLESHTFLSAGARFRDGADAVLTANSALRQADDDEAIRALLRDRGLPFTRPPADAPPEDEHEENDDAGAAKTLLPDVHPRLLLADEDWYAVAVPPHRRLLATADFDSLDLDLELELRATDGTVLASSTGVSDRESVTAPAGEDGATFLLRAFPRPGTPAGDGYDLTVLETDPESVRAGRAVLRRAFDGHPDVVTVTISPEKAETASRLVVRSRVRGGGAVNDVRVTTPSGGTAAEFGSGRTPRGARVVVPLTESGTWRIEVTPRDGTSGAYVLRTRVR